MRLTILAVGKLRPYYREACDDYRRRLERYATVDEIEIRAARIAIPDKLTGWVNLDHADRITHTLNKSFRHYYGGGISEKPGVVHTMPRW